jgi:hypothetical protein
MRGEQVCFRCMTGVTSANNLFTDVIGKNFNPVALHIAAHNPCIASVHVDAISCFICVTGMRTSNEVAGRTAGS